MHAGVTCATCAPHVFRTPLLCGVLLPPAAASYVVTVNAVSGVTPDGGALAVDGPYGMWSLDAEQVCGCAHGVGAGADLGTACSWCSTILRCVSRH